MKKNLLFVIFIQLFLVACSDNELEQLQAYFTLSETNLTFRSAGGTQTIDIEHPNGQIGAKVVSEDSDWCTVSVAGNAISVSVSENVLVKNRNAIIEVTSGNESIKVLVRQTPKIFDRIVAVSDLAAISGPGQVTLTWVAPTEDNFSHVIIRYTKGGEEQVITVPSGVEEYVITDLRSSDGEYTFSVQSVDKENDLGEIVSVVESAQKLVEFGFERSTTSEWLPFYLRNEDTHVSTVRVGADELNEEQVTIIQFAVDEEALTAYNQQNGTQYTLMPATAYSLPDDVAFTGASTLQDVTVHLDISNLEDERAYAIPLTIDAVQNGGINEAKKTVILLYRVDDLAGWYTVDRLPKSGEGAGSYPGSPENRRRYIKRTGTTTWQTGYLFRSYASSENHVGANNDIQYISLDPITKAINIRQGDFVVSENANAFSTENNELHIEYLYRDWAGWWTHERMHNRSFQK